MFCKPQAQPCFAGAFMPLAQNFCDYTLHQILPNFQGIAALMALGLLSHFDLSVHPVDHPDTQHLLIEAMELASADVYAHIGNAAHMAIAPQSLLDPAYLAEPSVR